MRAPALILCLLVGGRACHRPPARTATTPECAATWHAVWSADSSIALCLPAGFVRSRRTVGSTLWARGGLDAPDRAWLSLGVDTSRASAERWLPRLATPASCTADCSTADSVVRHVDSLRVGVAYTETGLVSGGFPGFRRQPLLVGGWTLPTGERVWVHGFAMRGATLDTLRAALRTMQLRSP